eukprot:TRINITY_DN777979_c0_g1_i1.p1 TRINITY_DN777979_c0_g1~~TRINITY_DN777979_c0_g1_i1.p1  ORF type:complete len:248 (+),score=50.62 TRINITY_DN777979_c0_g1_i1:129-872(+)
MSELDPFNIGGLVEDSLEAEPVAKKPRTEEKVEMKEANKDKLEQKEVVKEKNTNKVLGKLKKAFEKESKISKALELFRVYISRSLTNENACDFIEVIKELRNSEFVLENKSGFEKLITELLSKKSMFGEHELDIVLCCDYWSCCMQLDTDESFSFAKATKILDQRTDKVTASTSEFEFFILSELAHHVLDRYGLPFTHSPIRISFSKLRLKRYLFPENSQAILDAAINDLQKKEGHSSRIRKGVLDH